ncbi:MAG: efflux RND transporter periplasmic adaptor subunit, partial [Vicinamibacterales bacterium]
KQVGDTVREGQLIATMHGHAMHDAWAGYRKAIAARERAEAELAYATDALARTERLLAARAIAAQDVRRAQLEKATAAEHVADARAEVTRSIEELEHVGVHVTDTGRSDPGAPDPNADEPIPVRSPLAGVVLERLVTPGTTVVPGSPLYVVSDLSSVWVTAEVDEALLPQLRTGRPVDVRVAAWPGEVFTGRVTFIADVVNAETRRVTVRATMANTARRLKPQMFATVGLHLHEPREVLWVPKTAVQTVDGKPAVFVAGTAGQFAARPVTVGAVAGDRVEVLSGLTAGERVAATGAFALKSVLAGPAAGE